MGMGPMATNEGFGRDGLDSRSITWLTTAGAEAVLILESLSSALILLMATYLGRSMQGRPQL